MDALGGQKVLHSSGSFTGFRPLQQLGSGYLEAAASFKQPLCGNEEGWGPLSPYRYDFTPCFIDVWIAIVAIGGLVLGLGAVWLLRQKKPQVANANNLPFWLKQVRRPQQSRVLAVRRDMYPTSPPPPRSGCANVPGTLPSRPSSPSSLPTSPSSSPSRLSALAPSPWGTSEP